LTLRYKHFSNSENGATVTSVILAAPLLEKIYMQGVDFGAADVEALDDALRMRTALQSLRIAYFDKGRGPEIGQMLDALRERMRICCPRFQDAENDNRVWENHFCQDIFSKASYI